MITVTFNGESFQIPERLDDNWAEQVTNFLVSVAGNALSKAGGSFPLTSPLDFGALNGILVKDLTSKSANPASTGFLRLANDEGIAWRNAADDANIILKVGTDNKLYYAGLVMPDGAAISAINGRIDDNENDLDVLEGDLFAQTDTIDDIYNLLASGVPINQGGTGATVKATALNNLLPTQTGNSGKYLKTNGSSPSWDTISGIGNPMTTQGDMIYGGASGTPSRVAGVSTAGKRALMATGNGSAAGTPAWESLDDSTTYTLPYSGVSSGNQAGCVVSKIGRRVTLYIPPFSWSGGTTAQPINYDISGLASRYTANAQRSSYVQQCRIRDGASTYDKGSIVFPSSTQLRVNRAISSNWSNNQGEHFGLWVEWVVDL